MNEKVRLQVLDDSTEHEWQDVGNKAGDQSVPVNVGTLPLPTGAATSAKQDTLLTELQQKTEPTDTQPVSAVTLPLPTGAATSANQTTMITNLQTLNSLIPAVYDYISLAYTGSNLTTVIFKTGGSGGTVVSTLTLAYTGSNLTSVTKT